EPVVRQAEHLGNSRCRGAYFSRPLKPGINIPGGVPSPEDQAHDRPAHEIERHTLARAAELGIEQRERRFDRLAREKSHWSNLPRGGGPEATPHARKGTTGAVELARVDVLTTVADGVRVLRFTVA